MNKKNINRVLLIILVLIEDRDSKIYQTFTGLGSKETMAPAISAILCGSEPIDGSTYDDNEKTFVA